MNVVLVAALLLLVVTVVLQVLLLLRRPPPPTTSPELLGRLDGLNQAQERTERSLRDVLTHHRDDARQQGQVDREQQAVALREFGNQMAHGLAEARQAEQRQLEAFALQLAQFSAANERAQAVMRDVLEKRLQHLTTENTNKLEEMRVTVDEKLQGTLEKRLGESFQQVSERLEQVHKGLGEMQVLATGVGDLKRVLTNVKARGGWGEVQLESLLAEVMAPEQYQRNVTVRPGATEVVEFALRLPGRQDGEQAVWLPIDSKFPLEDWQRLLDAQDRADPVALEAAGKALEVRVKACAKDVHLKYVQPPWTTDFGIVFLPVEGLYAEISRRPALLELLQREHRVIVAGPTTLAALLNSLQMGFRTLAIQKRSSEVWKVLGEVKTEFGKFGDVLDGVRKKLDEAARKMDDAATRNRAIQRRLREVQALPVQGEVFVLPVEDEAPGADGSA
jgi:DNA recombination protein RmuC